MAADRKRPTVKGEIDAAESAAPTVVQSSVKKEPWELEFSDDEPAEPAAGVRERPSMLVESPEGRSWRVAANIVNSLKPVPRLLWPAIHAVYGKPGVIQQPDAMVFSAVAQVVIRAAQDKTLASAGKEGETTSLSQAVSAIGRDVAAAVCLVHAVCRRIYSVVPERVARPIVDDALLRTQLGFYTGIASPQAGAGRGMIAGFAGRCGLAVQIAAGDLDQAQRALTGLASGKDISQVCISVYGCDPLEVAALTLISAGCCREIAYGISSYTAKGKDVEEGSEQYRWLALFAVIEGLRMGHADRVESRYWQMLGYDGAGREALNKQIIASQRRGHGWQWITQPLLGGESEPAKEPRSRSGEGTS